MGPLKWGRVLLASLLLIAAGLAVLLRQGPVASPATARLSSVFTAFGAWRAVKDIPLDEKIRNELKLDDFLFRRFSDGRTSLVLYIGYYYSQAKVGAAHDPLVCFPGQGWVLSGKETTERLAHSPGGPERLTFVTMKAERDEERELLLYWFQADTHMTANTFMQKLLLLRAKILGQGQHNAFVRISVSAKDATLADAQEALTRFVADFYPVFLDYVRRTANTAGGGQSS